MLSAVLLLLSSSAGFALQQADTPATSATTTLVLAPVADTFVASRWPRTVYGGSDNLDATNEPGNEQATYIRFDVPGTASDDVVSARLILTRTMHHLSGIVSASAVTDSSWSEQTMSAQTAPDLAQTLDSQVTDAATRTVSLDVTSAVVGGAPVTLAVTSSLDSGVVVFRSRETGVDAPQLLLTLRTGKVVLPAPPLPITTPPDPQPSSTASASPTVPAPPSSSDAPTPPPTGGSGCGVSVKLVPSCGFWWGIAPKAHTSVPRDVALTDLEQEAQTPFSLMHTYHENGELFPTAMERNMAFEPGKNRVLLINWKPATDMTWAAVAAGGADARIDAEAAYLKSTFDYPFLLAIYHEPENDVNPAAGSGMTASDYAAMFRHTALRLRADGATKLVFVMDYMGFDNYAQESWFGQLWPGDDVVDWIGLDPYGSGATGVYRSGDFSRLVNRPSGSFPGYYTWATKTHPGKPIMLAEWGVDDSTSNPSGKAAYFDSVSAQLGEFPAIKALVYFDYNGPSGSDQQNQLTTSPDTSPQSLAAFRRLSAYAQSQGPTPVYRSGQVEPLFR